MLNSDDISSVTATPKGLTDKNLFTYCDNNPIVRGDEAGYFWGNILLGATVGATISIGTQLLSGSSVGEINWREVGGAAISGAYSVNARIKFSRNSCSWWD